MRSRGSLALTFVAGAVCAGGLLKAAATYAPHLKEQWMGSVTSAASENVPAKADGPLVCGINTVQVPPDVVRRLGIETSPVHSISQAAPLELPGTLILDATKLSRIHSRFAGEVVQIGSGEETAARLIVGKQVRRGELLAVIWSRELGEKKSEFVDAISQYRVDRETYGHLMKSAAEGAIPDRILREAERKVETDRIAMDRAVRTLETWRVSAEEIQSLRAEAERRLQTDAGKHEEQVRTWARLEVRAPLDGVVLERNAALGDLVDTNLDLFKIVDLSQLRVVVHAYEEDLAGLDAIPEDQRRWTIRIGSDPGDETRVGRFDSVGCIIDPNQHTALVMGWVDNANGRLRIGQFITAAVDLPASRHDVAIPTTALLEEGKLQFVFVQAAEKEGRYTRQQVAVSRRTSTVVFVRNRLTPEERQSGVEPLEIGQRVVSSGVVPLSGVLEQFASTTASAE